MLRMKSSASDTLLAKGIFETQHHFSGIDFSNDMSMPQITWHNLWKHLLTSRINPSITLWNGRGFIFKWIFHHGWEIISDVQCSDDWNIHFVKFEFCEIYQSRIFQISLIFWIQFYESVAIKSIFCQIYNRGVPWIILH